MSDLQDMHGTDLVDSSHNLNDIMYEADHPWQHLDGRIILLLLVAL